MDPRTWAYVRGGLQLVALLLGAAVVLAAVVLAAGW